MGSRQLFRRKPKSHERERLFDDLPPQQEAAASLKLSELLKRRPWAAWRYPVLIGRARVVVQKSPEEWRKWALQRQARRGGLAVQRIYREQGRDTITKAREISLLNRKHKREAAEEAERRKQLGLPPPARTKCWPID